MLQETIARDRPVRCWEEYVVPQCWESFTDDDHQVWDLLFARQVELLGTRVVSAFFDGIDLLRLSHPGVPDVDGLNAIGWKVTKPRATFYVWARIPRADMTSAEFAKEMLERAHIVVIPGTGYGSEGEGYLRISFATSMDNIETDVWRHAT